MWFLPFIKPVLDILLKRLDPATQIEAQRAILEMELQVRQAEAQAEAARAKEFADFIAATQPSSERVYVWVNSLIALVRPAMAVFTLVGLIAWTEKWKEILTVLSASGIWGAIGISPLLVWVLGRDGLRMVLGAIAAVRGGQIPPEVLPSGIPTPAPRPIPALPAPKPPVIAAPAQPPFKVQPPRPVSPPIPVTPAPSDRPEDFGDSPGGVDR